MEKEAKLHTTHHCSAPLYGYLLEAGDMLKEGDLYDSTSGKWEICPCPGLTIQGNIQATWIRPADKK